ncbi:MAG: PHP domain-containing protein [Candidatus Kariarchaeaceae archaeon]
MRNLGFPKDDIVRIDLHCHSEHSLDASSPVMMLAKTASDRNLDGFIISDHNTIAGWKDIKKAIKKFPDLIIYRGVEISAKEGHVLAIGINDLVPRGLSLAETINQIHEQGGIASPTHPFDFLRSGVGEMCFDLPIDSIETHNGSVLIPQFNYKAQSMAKKYNLPGIGGSDSHTFREMGLGFTECTHLPADEDELIKLIKKGRTLGKGSHMTVIEKVKRRLLITINRA